MTRYVYAIDDGKGSIIIGRRADPHARLADKHCKGSRLVGFVCASREQLHELRSLLAPWSSDGVRYLAEGPVLALTRMLSFGKPTSTMMTPTIAEHVINKCGGAKAVAEMLGLDVASVHKWKYPSERGGTNGLIPASRQQELIDKARDAGIDLEPADFFARPFPTTAAASPASDGEAA